MAKEIPNRKPCLYLCGGIKGLSDEECSAWRNYVKEQWNRNWCLDPFERRDFRGTKGHENEIVNMDKRDIMASDVLFVYWTEPSAGTCMEILFAHERHIPVVVVNVSIEDNDELSPWVLYHSTIVVDSIDDGIEWIRKNF